MTNHLRPSSMLLALIILIVPFTGARAAGSPPLLGFMEHSNSLQWPQECVQLKKRLSNSPMAFLTFTPMPKLPSNIGPAWKLIWHGLTVPVPATKYTHFGFLNTRSPNMLMLATANNHHVFFSFDPGGSDYAASLRALWDKHTDVLHVTTYGYTLTPKNLTCTGDNVKRQKRIALGLGFKILTKHLNAVQAAHRIQGSRYGILEYGHALKGIDTYWYSLQKHHHKGYYEISYVFPKDNPSVAHVALALATPEAATYSVPPTWISQLQIWLDKPTQSHWCGLLNALKDAHFDPENLRHLAKQHLSKNHPACQSPQQ